VVAVFTPPAPKEFNLHSEFDPSPSLALALTLSITHRRKARQAPLGIPAKKKSARDFKT
jgi:hypothetical protein